MRFLVIVKGNKRYEAGAMPSQHELAAMGKFNDELVKAGIMLAGEGLQPSSKGARITYAGSKRTVTTKVTRSKVAIRKSGMESRTSVTAESA